MSLQSHTYLAMNQAIKHILVFSEPSEGELRVKLNILPSGQDVYGPGWQGTFSKSEAIQYVKDNPRTEFVASGYWKLP